jgi:two-component system sensor kinase FixL
MANRAESEKTVPRGGNVQSAGIQDEALQKLFNLSLDMLCIADFEGHFLYINDAFERILGYPPEALLERPYIDLVHPDDRDKTLAALEQLSTGAPLLHFENRYRCQDGSYKWLAWTSRPVLEERLNYAVGRDITGQKAAEERQTEQADLLNTVLSTVPASIFWKDRNSVYLGVNNRFLCDTGLQTPEQVIGKTDYDMAWSREEADFYRECDRRVMDGGTPMLNIEETQQQADGRTVQILTSKVPLKNASGEVAGILGIYMDITALKAAEATAIKSEARLRTLLNSAAEFIFVVDPEGVIISANQYVYDHSGYTDAEILGKNIQDFFTRESQHISDYNFSGLDASGRDQTEIQFVCKDGRVIDVECSATAVPDENGELSTFLIIQRDITDRKRAAAARAEGERNFRAVFDSTYHFIGVLDPEGTMVDANQTALDFFGLDKEDVIGKPFWDIYCWSYSSDAQERLKAAIKSAAEGNLVRYEETLQGQDNTTILIDVTIKPVLDENGRVVFIIPEGRDITDQKQAEAERQSHQDEMAHVSRLSTMGEMASGMAHELNQPLTALISYCGTAIKLAESIPSLPEGYLDILHRATSQAHRAGDVIRHLREFVSKSGHDLQTIALDDLTRGVIDFISWELRDSDIKLQYRPDAPQGMVQVDKVQLEQVIINLIRNSVEALRQSGTADGRVDISTRHTGEDHLELSVTDNGPGINPAVAESLFEPYSTSKETGMGMGLSISRSIIEAHNGKLWIESGTPGATSFSLRLPAAQPGEADG